MRVRQKIELQLEPGLPNSTFLFSIPQTSWQASEKGWGTNEGTHATFVHVQAYETRRGLNPTALFCVCCGNGVDPYPFLRPVQWWHRLRGLHSFGRGRRGLRFVGVFDAEIWWLRVLWRPARY